MSIFFFLATLSKGQTTLAPLFTSNRPTIIPSTPTNFSNSAPAFLIGLSNT